MRGEEIGGKGRNEESCLALTNMGALIWIALRNGVVAVRAEGGGAVVEGHGVRVSVGAAGSAIVEAVLGLAPPGGDEDQIAEAILEAGGPDAMAAWYYAVERLARRGLMTRAVVEDGRPIATLVPITTTPSATAGVGGGPVAGRRYRLSRFAYLRREGETLVVESPRSSARVVLHEPAAAAVVARLAAFTGIGDLAASAAG